MRRRFGAAVTVLALAGAVAASPRSRVTERPPAGHTGGFGEPSCLLCHTGNDVNAFGGSVRIEGLPEVWEPGATYGLTVRLDAEETSLAGFQLSARFASGAPAGRNAGQLLHLSDRVGVLDSAGVLYAHQTRAGASTSNPDGASWTVTWIAPQEGSAVAFHVAANSGNGDNSPLGDLVFTSEVVVPPPVGVSEER